MTHPMIDSINALIKDIEAIDSDKDYNFRDLVTDSEDRKLIIQALQLLKMFEPA